ncbi:MAG TPA: uroporphyrinogen decarboxylase family protein, partial [Tepidisphaeraceae bacterium]|nr:uroporphyrinogen decarboxylase family protein [Tepidisphaeraceae bacterium]
MIFHHYAPPKAQAGREELARQLLRQYPSDVALLIQSMPSVYDEPWGPKGYSWMRRPAPPPPAHSVGLDAEIAISDWAQLAEILANQPDPDTIKAFPKAEEDPLDRNDRYTCIHWWNCLYEKAWKLRGMENLLMDFYINPRPVRQLMEAITDFSCKIIRRAARELNVDGVWVTDDIGTQAGPMFGLNIFREFFKPCYAKLIKAAHDNNMHFWLHSCGNIELFIEDVIEIGLDVLHPIQKYTMDERKIAEKFGGRICFWAGMDVQRILPRGTTDDVRREVRFMI